MKQEARREKAQGCLIGLACGDALGDLGRMDEYRKRYGIITNLYGEARSTDDTEFAVLTARILLDNDGRLTPDAVLKGWRRYILDQGEMGARGGAPLYGAMANLKRGLTPPLSGKYNVGNDDDGAAMRAAPHGIVFAGLPQMAAQSAELDAQISHYTDGIWAARAVAAAVAVAMDGGPLVEAIACGLREIPEDSWLGYAMNTAMRLCDQADGIEDIWEELHSALWTPSHSNACEALPQIFAISRMTAGDFRKGMFWACNFGRDADTIGAVVGAISGALHGLSTIPAAWVDKVRRPSGVCLKFAAQEDILEMAVQLALLNPSN